MEFALNNRYVLLQCVRDSLNVFSTEFTILMSYRQHNYGYLYILFNLLYYLKWETLNDLSNYH